MPDLQGTTVLLDFDGTLTTEDVCVHLLETLGADGWREIEDAYLRGAIGSRECLVRQWAFLPKDEQALRATAREVPLDPAAHPLVEGLKGAGAEVVVVSDGYGFYIEEALAGLDVTVLTNDVDWASGELRFPFLDRCCACSSCGVCKQAPVKDARRRGQTVVFVGDGVSDRKAALIADRLFAKEGLAWWCDETGVDFIPFETLADVHRALLGIPPP